MGYALNGSSGKTSSLRSFSNSNCQGVEHLYGCAPNGSSGKTPSLKSFPSDNCHGVEDPCRLRSEWFIEQDSISQEFSER